MGFILSGPAASRVVTLIKYFVMPIIENCRLSLPIQFHVFKVGTFNLKFFQVHFNFFCI